MAGKHTHQDPSSFASLVNKVRSNGTAETSSDALHDHPSAALPNTGLKRNTDEYKGKNRQSRSSSASSSSSIPSTLRPGDQEETAKEQEGPLGQGAGHHEAQIPLSQSPTSIERPALHSDDSIPPPRQASHSLSNGQDTARGGLNGDQGLAKGLADTLSLGAVYQGATNIFHAKGLNEAAIDVDDEPDKAAQSQGDPWDSPPHKRQATTASINRDNAIDPDERILPRSSDQVPKLADESGRLPDGLAGVKQQDAPGPMQNIVLDPRISHIHVSEPTAANH